MGTVPVLSGFGPGWGTVGYSLDVTVRPGEGGVRIAGAFEVDGVDDGDGGGPVDKIALVEF